MGDEEAEGQGAVKVGFDGGEGAVIEGELEQEAEAEVEPEQEQPAQDAPADQASTLSESLPSEPSSAEAAAPSETVAPEPLDPEKEPEFVNPGYPEPGEVYHLTGDVWGSAGRRETYKDGKSLSSATRRAALAIYEDHKPEGPGGQTEEAASAPAVSDAPTDPNDAFDVFTMGVKVAPDFATAKAALNALAKSDAWKAAMAGTDGHRVRQARMSLALRGEALKAEGKPWPDVLDDLLLFRCWCEITDDADAIQGNFAALVPTPLYQSLDADRRASFDASIKARMVQIRDGGA